MYWDVSQNLQTVPLWVAKSTMLNIEHYVNFLTYEKKYENFLFQHIWKATVLVTIDWSETNVGDFFVCLIVFVFCS